MSFFNTFLDGLASYQFAPPLIILFVCFFFLWKLLKTFTNLKNDVYEFSNSFTQNKSSTNSKLYPYYREICEKVEINTGKEIFKEDPVNHLANKILHKFKNTFWFKSGQYLTGIALIFTFLLIGQSVYHIGENLPKIGAKVEKSISNETSITQSPMNELGHAISNLRTKFWVSVLGIFLAIVYQFVTTYLTSSLYDYTRENLAKIKEFGSLYSTVDLTFQESQLKALITINETLNVQRTEAREDLTGVIAALGALKEIDVKVEDLAENVTKQLENMIDKSIGTRLAELLEAQKATSTNIANQLGKAIADSMNKEIEATFQKLAEALPNIVMGGATESSSRVAQTFEEIATTLPPLVQNMNMMVLELKAAQEDSFEGSKKVNSSLLESVSKSIENLNTITTANTASQIELLQKMSQAADSLTQRAFEGISTNTETINQSARTISNEINSGAAAFTTTAGALKEAFKEVSLVTSAIKETHHEISKNIKASLSEINTAVELIKAQNEAMSSSLNYLNGISTKLSTAPETTKNLILTTQDSSKKFEEVASNLNKQFVSGIEQLSSVFISKMRNMEEQTSSIKEAYKGASNGLREALSPVEELSETIETLNKTIKESINKKEIA